MSNREVMQQALEAMETNQYTVAELAPHRDVMKFNNAITALRKALEQPEQAPTYKVTVVDNQHPNGVPYEQWTTPPAAQPDGYGYALRLAVAIWEQHYKDVAPQWKPLDDLMGVLTQIDNMTSGLVSPPAAQRPWQGLTEGERNDLEDYCQMNIGKVAFDAIEARLKERNI